ncbi:MAG: aldehyde dehydrogenase family protein, partial [Neisseriaceae bacterium]|nr:aldehyde dehydrogenase family protein [Neisseriaceae bacterium]
MTHYFISQDIFHNREIYRRACDDWQTTEQQIAHLRQQQADFAGQAITQRTKALSSFAECLSQNAERIANAICQEVGRCLPECRAEVQKSLALIQYYVHLAPELLARKTVATTASLSQIAFEPLGLVLAVMPWNYPVWQVLRFAVPALCAGNACLVKPAPTVGRVTEMLFDLVGDDLPFQAAFLSHDDIEQAIANTDALAFTGSAKTGRHLAQIAGKYLKKCVLELGGSNAFIVLKDADIQAAAKDACHSRFRDAGQSCNAA